MRKQLLILGLAGMIGMGGIAVNAETATTTGAAVDQAVAGGRQQRKNRKHKKTRKSLRRKAIMNYARTNYPDEVKAIRELMKTDPKAAEAKKAALREKVVAEIKAQREKWHALIKKYRETGDEATLATIQKEITARYDKKITTMENRLNKWKAGIAKQENRLKELKANRDANIEKIMQRIKNHKGRHGRNRKHRKQQSTDQ